MPTISPENEGLWESWHVRLRPIADMVSSRHCRAMPPRDHDRDPSEDEAEDNSLGLAIAMGLPFGLLAGVLFNNIALGLAFGPAIGLIFYALKSRKDE